MSANTVIETIKKRAAELDLDPPQIARLLSSDHSTWRKSVTEIEKALSLHEIMIVLVLSPAQIHALFPRRTTNIFALGHPRYLRRFRSTLWQRAASFLAQTGFLCIAQNNHPVPAAVARQIALFACGGSCDTFESAECVDYLEHMFVFGDLPKPEPVVCKLHPLPQTPAVYYIENRAGAFCEDFIALEYERRTVLTLKYSRMETNIRAALRLGMFMEIFETDQPPCEEWLFYKEWYHSSNYAEPPPSGRNRLEMYKFYLESAGPELVKSLPVLMGQRTVDYEWTAGVDVLDKLMPPGLVCKGKPIDAWTVLKTTMDQCLANGVPHAIAGVVLRKMKAHETLRRQQQMPRIAQGEILTGYIKPPEEWVDENAWAKVVNLAKTTLDPYPVINAPRDWDLFLNL